MKQNIKQEIMDTARHLFSQQGFQNTSMRDIAAVLNISVGNLTYHFKKKEDLIEAILLDDHQGYQKPVPLFSLKEFDWMLHKIAMQKRNRPYYYNHYVQLAQISPAIYEMQLSVMRNLNEVLIKTLENFADNGILRIEFRQEYDKIAVVIMTLMVHGLPDFHKVQGSEKDTSWINCVWSIIAPCLSEQGQKEYQAILAQRSPDT